MASEIERLTERLLSEVAVREPLPPEEEARLAKLVAEGKQAVESLEDPGISGTSGSDSKKPRNEAAKRWPRSSSTTCRSWSA